MRSFALCLATSSRSHLGRKLSVRRCSQSGWLAAEDYRFAIETARRPPMVSSVGGERETGRQ
jgi:hypothetical protein